MSTLRQLKVRSTTRRNAASSRRSVDLGVGQHEGEHRRHVGLDHADALGHADHASRRIRPRSPRRVLANGVGGHHPARRRRAASVPVNGVGQRGQVGADPLHRVAPADHARWRRPARRSAAHPRRRPPRRRAPRRRPGPRGRWRRWRSSTRPPRPAQAAVGHVLAAHRARWARRSGSGEHAGSGARVGRRRPRRSRRCRP